MSAVDFNIWLVEALMASALLIVLVMLLRRPVAQYLGARAAYALWALPVLRLLLPSLPEGASPADLLPVEAHAVSITYVREAVQMPAAQFPWVETALIVWICGAALFLLVQALAYFRFRQLMLSDGTVVGRQDNVTVLESVYATGPLAFGILHRYVVVPIDFSDRYTGEEQAMAFAHELEHHRRGDLIANLVALLLLGLHWCNPIAWMAYRAFRTDQELACDARVLARHGRDQAQAYGRAILKAATATPLSTGNRFSFCHLNSVDTLKGRLKMLSNHTASLHRITWGMSAVAVVTAVGLALTASGSDAAQEMASVSQRFGHAKLVRLAALLPQTSVTVTADVPDVADTPEPPLAPEAPMAPQAPAAAFSPTAPIPPITPLVPRIDVDVPTRAEIAAMVPDVRVEHRCTGGQDVVTQQDYTDGANKRHVRVVVCNSAAQRTAMVEARAGLAEAHRAMASARTMSAESRAEAQADLAEARAEMARAREDMRRDMAYDAHDGD